jgi:NADPH-dependent glutamate synthase beta subunit-like oxidoreductase/ferredoxin
LETTKLNIDGKEIETKKGKTVLEAALEGGIYIPHLCHHPDLKPVGTCGVCVVDVEGFDEPPTSCDTQAVSGMVVRTKSPRVKDMRHRAMKMLLANHPPECVECSQYLNCELQSVKQFVGITEDVTLKTRIKPIPVNKSHPLFVHDFILCIKCGRCVRACNELRGVEVLQFIEEGKEKLVGIPEDKSPADAGCRFCGACVAVCPTGAIRDKEELMEGKKRREALVPCQFTCPSQIDVPRYVRLVGEGKFAEATAVIREKVPFPKVLGHVCNHPCESVCRRDDVNEAISIRDLKRFAAERDRKRLWEKNGLKKPSTGKKLAIIGSGPAGLTAAVYLTKLGHAVTVFEALPKAGGMMRYGIPAYRLPRDVLEDEIQEIENIGVTIKTNEKIEELDRLLLNDGYDSVLVACGTHVGKKLPIPGADLEGVLVGLDFLKEVNRGNKIQVGKSVLVLGGGSVAFDCARTARRLGANEVHIACLESGDGIPAARAEIEEGVEEGITIHASKTFTKILSENSQITGVECLDVASFEFDEDGELQIEPVDGSVHVVSADMVIFAVGQLPEIPDFFELDLSERGLIEVDSYTLDTSKEGVFAVGDAVTGTGSVIEAIASGKKGAIAVDRYLGGDGDIDERLSPPEEPKSWLGPGEGFAGRFRCSETRVDAGDRINNFQGIVRTLDEDAAIAESSRCLQCDLRLKITPVKFWGEYG